ncbi:MAG: pantoate--beta-alanine ligase [Spirochaetota bacterium]
MKKIVDLQKLQSVVFAAKRDGKTIALVPTMGYLHAGHISLVQAAQAKADITIVSIFVNPSQFNNPEDFTNYPKDLQADCKILEEQQVDIVFIPTAEAMYPQGKMGIQIRIESLMQNLCATTRPGHFEGVLTIICKLFHLSQPDHAFFGKKDYQQYLLVKRLAEELSFPVSVEGVDTLRESDGLAMSSRNARLDTELRKAASLIPRAYNFVNKHWKSGERDIKTLRAIFAEVVLTSPHIEIDYLEAVDPYTLEEKTSDDVSEFILATAIFVGKVRLIDNQLFSI